ncbi:glycosyltransferase [Desulfobacula phenolica]|uniref:Glycosyltransferase involved in cell wall bisynthesis n=1 Tax=Desulfobacula phenolica TaxID=90732 RepID=A0A1H2DTW4_9BACT|nr:glycosyltransferase [Desulfobacula phenolica]SDT86290.1 Glycosyltransferase involved in cell wall bisynthesis [Desulfobacula phenolica]
MNQNRFLIISQNQFGYHTDTYYYCRYLQKSFDISYICWDYNYKKISMDGIKVIYISRRGNIALRNLRFLFRVIKELKNEYDFHIIKYFRGCSFLKVLFYRQKFLFDIRTASVKKNKKARSLYNLIMLLEAKFFKHVSVISNHLVEKLGFSKKNIYILPLGADAISNTQKTFNIMKLLYVGTLENRDIDQTLKGFSRFYHEYKNEIKIIYTIVGGGDNNNENELKKIVTQNKINSVVDITGPIAHNKLKFFFDSHNIGVSYIPKTEYFDAQPPTKTFEYLVSGMPVIATNTSGNKAIITDENGILTNDTSDAFYNGLVRFYENRENYLSSHIRLNSMQYTWEKIVDDLKEHILKIIKSNMD